MIYLRHFSVIVEATLAASHVAAVAEANLTTTMPQTDAAPAPPATEDGRRSCATGRV